MKKLLLPLFFLAVLASHAVTFTSNVATGNWTTPGSWTVVGVDGDGIPDAADDTVYIQSGHNITMNGNSGDCLALIIDGTINWTSTFTTNVGAGGLTLNNGALITGTNTGILNIFGNFSVPSGATVTVGRCTFTVVGTSAIDGNLTFNSNTGIKTFGGVVTLTSTGSWVSTTISTTTNLIFQQGIINDASSFSGGAATFNTNPQSFDGTTTYSFNGVITVTGITITNNGTVNLTRTVAGALTGVGGTWAQGANSVLNYSSVTITIASVTFSTSPNTVRYNSAALNQTIFSATYDNLVIATSGGAAGNLSTSITVNTTLTVNSGAIANSTNNLTVLGDFDIDGTYNITNTTGTKDLNNISISATGVWTCSAAENFTITGDVVQNGTFTSSTGTYTFSGAGKTITGSSTFSIGTVDFSGSYTNNHTNLSIVNLFSGSGTFTQGATGKVNVQVPNGSFTISTFNGSTSGNTVAYTGVNQDVIIPTDGAYHHLQINNTGTASITAVTDINGDLDITGILDAVIITGDIYVGGNWTNSGTFIHANALVTFDGTGGTQFVDNGVSDFGNLYIDPASTVELANNITVMKDLSIAGNLDLSSSNYSVTVSENLQNDGVLTAQNGNIILNGTALQTISGANPFNFFDLTISNSSMAGVSVAHDEALLGGLYFTTNCIFDIGANSFTLVSDGSATAHIADLSVGGTLTGTGFIVQRYVASRNANWADLASPIQSSTLDDWDRTPSNTNEIYMSGVGGPDGDSYENITLGTFYSVNTWDEPSADWAPVTSTGITLTPGVGFEVFLGDDLNTLNDLTFDTRGTPTQGSVPTTLSSTGDGYNLVGNPYASYIDWTNLLASASNIDNTYLIFDGASGTYASYGAGNEIPPSQGFWIHASGGAPSLTFDESHKTNTTSSLFNKSGVTGEYFTLTISNTNNVIPFSHTTKIALSESSLNTYDIGDMPYLKSPVKLAPSITTLTTDNKKLCLNNMNKNTASIDVPLAVTIGLTGNYTIESSGLSYIKEFKCVVLEDKVTNTFTNFKTTGLYNFTATKEDDLSSRFVLHLDQQENCQFVGTTSIATNIIPSKNLSVRRTENGNLVQCAFEAPKNVSISVVDMLGQNIVTTIEKNVSTEQIMIQLPTTYQGVYFVNVLVDGKIVSTKFIN